MNTPKNSSAPSDARRRAEEALASSLVTLSNEPRYADLFDEVSNLREVIMALLAEEDEAAMPCAALDQKGNGER